MTVLPGAASPLGATYDGRGVNFALTSEEATAVHLCLFDAPDDTRERLALPLARTGSVWHGYVEDLRPGQLYGYRVFGLWDPAHGRRFNPAKVLLDPYAKAIGRPPHLSAALCGHASGTDGNGAPDDTDSAPWAALGAVVDPHAPFDWGGDAPPRVPWDRMVIYEAHVKGFTALHPDLPQELRGKYLGLAAPPVVAHLKDLGVTTVELMPVHAHADELALAMRGLANYWGYNTVAYFAPDPRFATGPAPEDAIRDFREMVRALHAGGLEVILDVVYNHTADGDHLGPTLSLRGLDNAHAYRLSPILPGRYEDFTGCGNTLDLRSPAVLQLVVDSLRYWVDVMHVDGFRFDLTSALVRGGHDVDWRSPFLQTIAADPVLSRVKLIAEPWDASPGGYQLGGFPAEWSEWNDRYRDAVRRFWRGDAGAVPELATRLAGSRDVFHGTGRTPRASVNFVTVHDGFTLADLVVVRRQAQRGQRRSEPRRQQRQLQLELRRRRARRRCRRARSARAAAAEPAADAGGVAGRADAERRRRARPHAAWQQQRLLPRLAAHVDTLELAALTVRSSSLPRACSHCALPIQCSARRHFSKDVSGASFDVLWLRPEGGEMTGADWARSRPSRDRHVAEHRTKRVDAGALQRGVARAAVHAAAKARLGNGTRHREPGTSRRSSSCRHRVPAERELGNCPPPGALTSDTPQTDLRPTSNHGRSLV